MKKFVIFTLIIAMVAGAAFAQFANGMNANAWGRGSFAPLVFVTDDNYDGNTVDDTGGVYAGSGVTWGGPKVRVDFRIHGATDFVGFTVSSTADGSTLGAGDDGYHIWAKPFGNDLLKLTVGAFVNDTLRGKIGSVNGGFECFSLPGNNEEDPIFTRFGMNDQGGPNSTYLQTNAFMLSSAPVEGLFLGIMVPGKLWEWGGPKSGTEAKDSYRYMQIGAGYNIDGIGHIRAQWIGGYFGEYIEDKDDEDYVAFDYSQPARIEAAFALTAVDNLLIDLGGKFWLPVSGKDSKQKVSSGVDVSLGASFRAEAFNIMGRVDAKSIAAYDRANEDDESAKGMVVDVRLTPAYDFDAATLGLDLGLRITGASTATNGDANEDSKFELGFGGFVKKGLAGGYVKAGLTYTLAPSVDGKTAGAGVFMIPVVLEYAFF